MNREDIARKVAYVALAGALAGTVAIGVGGACAVEQAHADEFLTFIWNNKGGGSVVHTATLKGNTLRFTSNMKGKNTPIRTMGKRFGSGVRDSYKVSSKCKFYAKGDSNRYSQKNSVKFGKRISRAKIVSILKKANRKATDESPLWRIAWQTKGGKVVKLSVEKAG